MKTEAGSSLTALSGTTYRADVDGLVRVQPMDVDSLVALGAATAVIPHAKHLKVAPFSHHHFLGKTHQADARGLLLDVPHDTAIVLIRNGSAVESTDADSEAAADPAPADETTAEAAEKARLEAEDAAKAEQDRLAAEAAKAKADAAAAAKASGNKGK